MLRLGEYLPDLPSYVEPNSPENYCTVATNCIPQKGYYTSFPSSMQTSVGALDARCQGAQSFQSYGLLSFNIAGTASKLWLYKNDGTFEDVSIAGGYTTPIDSNWYYTQFEDTILATNGSDPIQSFVMGSSTDFADLGGTPPEAKYIANIRNHIILANTDTPFQVNWSDLGNPATWSGGLSGSYGIDPTGGSIVGVVGGEYGVIFSERAITRMDYLGSGPIFQFSQVERDRGCYAEGSIVKFGSNVFYLAQDGFYVFDGTRSIPIGEEKVNSFFFNSLNVSYLDRIKSVLLVEQSVIIMIYPDGFASSGTPNRGLCYNYVNNVWSYISDIMTETLFISRSIGYTIDTVDSIYATIDSVPYSFDSRFWAGGQLVLVGFNSSHYLISFIGSALDATFETAESNPTNSTNRTTIPWLKPMVTGNSSTSVTLAVGQRNNLIDSITYTGDIMVNSRGLVPTRINARYIRVRMKITGGFDKAIGIEVMGALEGAM